MFDFFPLFLDGEQKRGKRDRKVSGKTGNTTAGKGDRQIFTDLIAYILGRVTSDFGSSLADYTAFDETLYYWLCGMSL